MTSSPSNIHIEQDLIDELEHTSQCRALFERVLDKSPQECLLTDLSTLSDFCGSGMPLPADFETLSYGEFCDVWDRWVLARIEAEFGVRLTSTRLTLVQVIEQLRASSAQVH